VGGETRTDSATVEVRRLQPVEILPADVALGVWLDESAKALAACAT